MSLELRQMRHVIAVADHGSFARAASALGLSQPALSRSIQAVEHEIGQQAFVRRAHGVEQTDGGRLFVARIRQIVQLAEDLDRNVAGERRLSSGHVHLGAGPYPAQSVLTEALARFTAAHPRINVRVIMREWDELLRRLRGREIEFFLAETSTFDGENDLDIEPCEPHSLLILVRRGHPLAGRGPLTMADCFAYPNTSLTRIPPRVLGPLQAAQRRSPDVNTANRAFPAVEFNALDAVRKIVLGSDAIMFAPPSCIEEDLESGRLVALGTEPYLTLRYGIVKLKTHSLSAAGARFLDFVREAEWAYTQREGQLLERWRPQPVAQAPARGLAPAVARARSTPRTRVRQSSAP